jgi:thymidylate kinase
MSRAAQESRPTGLLISFSGMDGSGKSTQIETLCMHMTQAGLPVSKLAFWDDVAGLSKLRAGFSHRFLKSTGEIGRPGKPAFRNDKNNRAWYLLLARSLLYVLDALNLRRVVAKVRRRHRGAIVFDRYIYDQLATLPLEYAVMRAYARMILAMAPKPDLAYLLDAEPERARERKPEYPVAFLYKYRRSYLELSQIAGLNVIEPLSEEVVQREVIRRLQACGKFRAGVANPKIGLAPAAQLNTPQ